MTFEDAWPNRKRARFGDLDVFVIGEDDFIRNKRASGRPKDLVDADTLADLIAPDD